MWYLPQFGVGHPKKKIHVVFDTKFKNVALNDLLLSGPDHINSLLGILIQFRKERIALSCDIKKKFYNRQVIHQHRDFFRFLWVDEGFQKIRELQMTVHLFGVTSSLLTMESQVLHYNKRLSI